MTQLTVGSIYQLQINGASKGVYLKIEEIENSIAKSSVVFLTEQPFENKIVSKNEKLFVLSSNLCSPDFYPVFSDEAGKWIEYVNKPILTAALELCQSHYPNLGTELRIITATAASPNELKVGQHWLSEKGEKLEVEKLWDKQFIVKDKFGDRKKYLPSDLYRMLKDGNYKLQKSLNLPGILKVINVILLPLIGFAGVAALTKLIQKFMEPK